MADSLAGIVLAAGAGTRLMPLTTRLPKALCPVGDRPMLDHAVARLAPVLDPAAGSIAVNAHHRARTVVEHVQMTWPGVHVQVEQPVALGTAGAVGNLRPWIDGRPVVVVNADAQHEADLARFVGAWDRERVAVLTTTPGAFGPQSTVLASLLPPQLVAGLRADPSGLWEVVWRNEVELGRLQTVHCDAEFIDCGTPGSYLRANLEWAGRGGLWVHPEASVGAEIAESVVGRGAVVEGTIERCVVWPGSTVHGGEHLRDAIRASDITVLVR
ncbi:MAG: sugar phosphate nucleotidyltransferase [Microthrixaceae bacterium]